MGRIRPFWLKIFKYSILVYLTGFLLFGVASFLIVKHKLIETSKSELTSIIPEKQNEIIKYVQSAKYDIEEFAHDSIIRELTYDSLDLSGNMSFSKFPLKTLANKFLDKDSKYSNLIIYNTAYGVSFKKDPEKNLTVTYLGKSYVTTNNAVTDSNTIVNILNINEDSTNFLISISTRLKSNKNNFLIITVEIPSKAIEDMIENPKYTTYLTLQAKQMVTPNQIIISKKDSKTLLAISSFSLDKLKMQLVVEMKMDNSYIFKKLSWNILTLGTIIFILSNFVLLIIFRRLTLPIEKLKIALEDSENGKDDSTLLLNSNDEIGLLWSAYSKIAMRLKHTIKQLVEREDRLDHFYLATADGILIHQTGSTLLFNPALLKLTGFSNEELQKYRPFDILIVDEDILRSARENKFSSFEAELKTSKGKKLQVEVQLKNINFRGQAAESLVIRDITHRKSIEKELQQERKRHVKSVIDGQEKERQRLSRELHDGLGQNLVAIKLKLESIPPTQAGELNSTLNQVKQMFNHTIEEIRRISNNLMPAALKDFSLAVVLRNLCTEIESNSGISIGLAVGVLPESLDQVLKTYVYRIVQEALTNVVKHSGANRAVVSVFSDFSYLHLQIEDNGVGFNPATLSDSGNGLYNMKERAILLGGKINIISSTGKGVKIIAEFPLNQPKSEQYD